MLPNTPIITKTEIKKLRSYSDDYAYTLLNRLKKKNRIRQIKKGKYTAIDNAYVIFSNLYIPSYISFWSASYIKGYTEQIVNTIHVITTKNYPAIDFENYHVEFHRFKKRFFFGYEKVNHGKYFVFIADDEKLLLDCLLLQENIGNFDELKKLIINASINEEKIVDYLNRINSTALNKRVGFLLEYYKGIDISSKVEKDRNYALLTRYNKPEVIDNKWRVKHDLN